MSDYTKPCTYCKAEIRMSNDSGKWKPLNLDGSFHSCKKEMENQNGRESKQTEEIDRKERKTQEEMIPVPKSILIQLIKFVEGQIN